MGVNAVFKRMIKSKYQEWMISKFEEVVYRKLNSDEKIYRAASKHQLLIWIFEAWKELKDETIEKSFFALFST